MNHETMTSHAFGRAVSVTARFAAAADLRPFLPYWWQDCDAPSEFDVEIFGVDEASEVMRELEFWVAEHATEAVFIHAALVAVGDRALVLPGRSLTGKSTLTAALLRAGACYGSDEYALLTPDGLVSPYPRPLMLRTPDGVQRIGAADLGATVIDRPLAVHAIGDVRYEDGGLWSASELTPGDAVLHLIDNAVAAQTRSTDVFDAALAAVSQLRHAVRGVRGDPDTAAHELLELLR